MKKILTLAALLALPLAAQAIEKQGMSIEEAQARMTLARQAVLSDPPRDALMNSPLASHPMFKQVFATLDINKINETAAQLMAETFTPDELKALVAFQTSPEGKSIHEKMPAYQKMLGATMQNYLTMAFQQMMAQQGSASSLPLNAGSTATPGNALPPMAVPDAAPTVQPAALPTGGGGTPLKH